MQIHGETAIVTVKAHVNLTLTLSCHTDSLLFPLCSLVDLYATVTREASMKAEAGPAMLSLHQPIEIFCSYPDVEFKGWPQCERYVPHALVCADLVKQSDLMLLEAADLLNSAGHYLRERARYCEAEPLYVHVLAICEEQLGASHPCTAISLNNLADLYQCQGKYSEAEPLYMRALQIREEQLGHEHPDTAQSLGNLATLYYDQGKYAQAEPLYVRALAIHEKQLGHEHPNTATSLNNLALLYDHQGLYDKAELLYMRALAIYEQASGPQRQQAWGHSIPTPPLASTIWQYSMTIKACMTRLSCCTCVPWRSVSKSWGMSIPTPSLASTI